ncbi:MAG: ribonuclease HII [Hyphomicrobiaceae bacterium]|nr:ribonuclease HII [Hyphomicrobiaceae bacterium]
MTRLCLSQVRLRYVVEGRPLERATEACLKADGRPGAKAILAAVARRRFENRSEGQRLRKLLRYEVALWSAGAEHVAGVDEAGVSPLAGPVAAAAVIFAPGSRIPGVDDSKKLAAAARDDLADAIKARAVAWSVAFAEVEEIDSINIYWASRLAMRRAIAGLARPAEHVLVDGWRLKGLKPPQQAIIGGDAKSLSIAAASILAKTARDALMCKLDAAYPGYGFARHKGYPVPEHRSALARLGACAIHRRSFAPVRTVLGLPPLPPWPTSDGATDAAPHGAPQTEA